MGTTEKLTRFAAGQNDQEANKAGHHVDRQLAMTPNASCPSSLLLQAKYPPTATGEKRKASSTSLHPMPVTGCCILTHRSRTLYQQWEMGPM